jgi:leucyl-tRNA synthetase
VPIPEKDLPLKLPKVESYVPTETGESPLAAMKNWVNTHCPECGGPARRETDTMPNWAGSSWYYLRYADPENVKMLASKKALDYWTPVDWYNGGMEHTTLHLLYSRFWHKFLYDIGVVPTKEPYQKRTSHGLILAEGGVKMSKSKGNVVNPDDIVRRFGADTLRVYEMFMGPFDQDVAWSTESIAGSRRFLEKVWKTQFKINREELRVEDKDTHALLHKTIKKVSEDIEGMRFNTAISALMIFVNEMEKSEYVALATYSTFLVLLSPFAPHIAEELWLCLGGRNSITFEMWPKANPKFLKEESVEIVVQVNGKLRARLRVAVGMEQGEIERLAREDEGVKKYLANQTLRKVVFVPDRLINFVIG